MLAEAPAEVLARVVGSGIGRGTGDVSASLGWGLLEPIPFLLHHDRGARLLARLEARKHHHHCAT